MAIPTDQEINRKVDRKEAKALGLSTSSWLIVFALLALVPVFNLVTIPLIIVGAVLALAIYVSYVDYRPRT